MLPVAHRELVVAARKPTTCWSRTASAGIAFLIVLFMVGTVRASTRVGPEVLKIVTTVLFIEALLAGVRYTSDALSEEKREGTLGLLFLTNLGGLDVVAGKAAARALPALYNLVAVIPIFGLSLLFGGVTGRQVLELGTVLIVTNLFSLAAGLFVSSRGVNERNVLLGTALLVAGMTLLPPVIWKLDDWLGKAHSAQMDALLLVSPVFAFSKAGAMGSSAWQSCAVIGGLTVMFMTAAAFRVRHAFRETAAVQGEEKGRTRGPRAWIGLLQMNPTYWLVMRNRKVRRYWWLGFGLVLFGVFCRLTIQTDPPGIFRFVVVFGSYGLHLFCKFLLLEESVRRLNQDRRSGVLELMLTTPLPPGFILRGQKLAVRKLFTPVLGGLVIMNVLWMTEKDFLRHMFMFLPCSILLVFSDAQALLWRGMLNGLGGQRYTMTVMRTFFQVMGPPLLVIVLLFFALANTGMGNETAQVVMLFWTMATVLFNLTIARSAKQKLEQFRALAAGDKWAPAWVAGGLRNAQVEELQVRQAAHFGH